MDDPDRGKLGCQASVDAGRSRGRECGDVVEHDHVRLRFGQGAPVVPAEAPARLEDTHGTEIRAVLVYFMRRWNEDAASPHPARAAIAR
jgi:hypothetical protein